MSTHAHMQKEPKIVQLRTLQVILDISGITQIHMSYTYVLHISRNRSVRNVHMQAQRISNTHRPPQEYMRARSKNIIHSYDSAKFICMKMIKWFICIHTSYPYSCRILFTYVQEEDNECSKCADPARGRLGPISAYVQNICELLVGTFQEKMLLQASSGIDPRTKKPRQLVMSSLQKKWIWQS